MEILTCEKANTGIRDLSFGRQDPRCSSLARLLGPAPVRSSLFDRSTRVRSKSLRYLLMTGIAACIPS